MSDEPWAWIAYRISQEFKKSERLPGAMWQIHAALKIWRGFKERYPVENTERYLAFLEEIENSDAKCEHCKKLIELAGAAFGGGEHKKPSRLGKK